MRKKKSFKKALAGILTGSMLLVACTPALPAKAATAKVVDLNGKYHAALGIQTCTKAWYERMGYFFKSAIANPNYGTDKANKLVSKSAGEAPGTFTDVEIAGNGTYTVSLTDAEFGDEKHVSQLHVATDIPASDAIQFTNVTVNVNDKTILTFPTGSKDSESTYTQGGMVVLALNQWRMDKPKHEDFKKVVEAAGLKKETDTKKSAGGGYEILNGTGKEKISITFTVSGFSYNFGETPAAPAATASAQPGSANQGTAANGTNTTAAEQKVGGCTYSVTSAEEGTAAFVKADKTKAKITVPDTVMIGDQKLKVTSVSDAAFSGCKKLTSVTIGKNVASIGKNAFAKCSKLKTINCKKAAALKSVGKNALKGVNKKCKVLAPKGKAASYKKMFKNKGQAKTVKVK